MNIIYVDIETGGLAYGSPIIEVAAVEADLFTGTMESSFQAKLLFDEAACEPQALAINHFNREQWAREAQTPKEALRGLAEYVQQRASLWRVSRAGESYHLARVGGYKATSFDIPRLAKAMKGHGVSWPGDWYVLDVYELAVWAGALMPTEPKNHTLQAVADWCGLYMAPHLAHNAFEDAALCAKVAARLLGMMEGIAPASILFSGGAVP